MTETTDALYLELFPAWLRSLGDDVAALGEVVKGEASEPVKRYVVAGLNYLFKSLDLIPDGIDDLGFCDDAFVLRVAADLALKAEGASGGGEALTRLAADTAKIREFLGDDYARLEGYVDTLRKGAARGRTVDDILGDEAVRTTFLHEVAAWTQGFQPPNFTRDPKTLIKLKAFLSAKLP
jgi:uncharacterized membrane protein YkvA (DUF1232 family)